MSASLQNLRVDYGKGSLDESSVAADPFMQFSRWFDEAVAAIQHDANAMALATVDVFGAPSSRIVLLKDFDARGFVFHTNYLGRKGREIAANPRVALCFYWAALERQVRIEGTAEKISRQESEAYFRTRPRSGQIGAWASQQGKVLASRAELDKLYAEQNKKFGDADVPLPDYWGGYRVAPATVEFWQGRPSRLHDRIEYFQVAGKWNIRRLAP